MKRMTIPLPVLSDNNPFAKCSAANLTTENGTLQYDIVCPVAMPPKLMQFMKWARTKFAGPISDGHGTRI